MKKLILSLFILTPLCSLAIIQPGQAIDAYRYLSLADYYRATWSPNVVTVYYVADPTDGGSNSNSGTSSVSPWATVSKVTSSQGSFNPGDFILFHRGNTFTSGQINITVNGSAGNPVTFGNYGSGELPTFTGNGSQLANLWYFNSKSYITIDGLKIIDPTIDTTLQGTARNQISHIERAFTFDNASHHNIVKNCKITATGLFVFFAIGSHDNLASNNRANDLTMIVNTNDGGQPGNDDDYGCNYVVNAGNNNVIEWAIGIRLYGQSFDYTLDGGNDIISTGAGTADNFHMDYCYFFDCIGVIEIAGTCTGTRLIYSTVINCGQTVTFQSGTIDVAIYFSNLVETTTERPGQSNIMLNAGANRSLTMKNCNLWLVNGIKAFSSSTGITKDYNVIHTGGSSSYGLSLNSHEVNISADIWRSQTGAAETWDYRLSPTSAAHSAGVSVPAVGNTGYNGYDMGTPPNTGSHGDEPTGCDGCLILQRTKII